jgi:two-component system, OmpR family, sensor kinase
MMGRMKQKLNKWTTHIPIRWRLTLISLGLFTVLLSGLGTVILLMSEQALLNNQIDALHNEALLAVKGLRNHPFVLSKPPGPPEGQLSPTLLSSLIVLAERLTSSNSDAIILSPSGTVIVPSNDFPLAPMPIRLSPTEIHQAMTADSEGSKLVRDAHKLRQLVVLIPLVNDHQTVAILQISTPTSTIDEFITTLRFILLLGVGGALSIAIALTFPLIGTALRPLVEIERTSRYIAEERALSMRLCAPATNDEIGRLTLSFNQMVEQLEMAFKRQKQFVSDASHELRTPLTVLRGSLEMLLIGVDRGDIDTARRLARSMSSEVLRMQRLVEDLLALTRLDEGKRAVREDIVNVRSIIDKVYDQAQQLARGQDIRSDVAANIFSVRADPDRLQQILLNIVENAVKYTATDGCVKLVACNGVENTVVIEVRDNGKGIPAEALPHVFDRFYRVDSARSRIAPQRVGGSGLGLAIAKELIEAQGGTITIDSTIGQGTTVTIRLRAVMNDVEVAELPL